MAYVDYHYKLYTDGACSGNPGRGGWGAAAFGENEKLIMKCSGGFRLTTNNRMEILAVVKGLNELAKLVGDKRTDSVVTVFSDSQLVVSTMNEGWTRKTNLDLWRQLEGSISFFREVIFRKVKGHASNTKNILVDKLAVSASEKENATNIDTVYENAASSKAETEEHIHQRSILLNGEPEIKEIRLQGFDSGNREIRILLSNGSEPVISGFEGGFHVYNCTRSEARVVDDIAWRFLGWLNGKSL